MPFGLTNCYKQFYETNEPCFERIFRQVYYGVFDDILIYNVTLELYVEHLYHFDYA